MHYDKDEVIKALRENDGIMTRAAADVGCTRQTIARYCKDDPEIGKVRDECKDALIDKAEHSLKDLMFNAEEERVRFRATRFFLETIGKSRGYVRKVQNELPTNVVQILNQVFPTVAADKELPPAKEDGSVGELPFTDKDSTEPGGNTADPELPFDDENQ